MQLRVGRQSQALRVQAHDLGAVPRVAYSTRRFIVSASGPAQVPTSARSSVRANVAASPSPAVPSEGPSKPSPEVQEAKLRDNMPLAMTMASTAFYSYRKAGGLQPFKDTWANNTVITYTDTAYLASRYSYVLEVKLESAAKVPSSGMLDVPDPYVKLSLGPQAQGGAKGQGHTWTVASTVKDNNRDPTWNETFYLCGRSADLESLTLQLWDKDPDIKGGDDLLGEAHVVDVKALAAAPAGEAKQFSVALTNGGKPVPGATVKLSCRVTTFAQFPGRCMGDAQPITAIPRVSQFWVNQLRSGAVGLPDDQYRDDAYLATKYTGIVEVQVSQARGLFPADLNGKADPFVVVSVESFGEKWSAKTTVKDATLAPDWEETISLRIRDPSSDVVRLQVVDKDWFGTEAMGEAVLPLDELDLDDTAVGEFELELRLPNPKKGQEGPRGKLYVRARLFGPRAFSQGDEDVLPAAVEDPPLPPMAPVAYVDCRKTDTQAWLYVSEDAVADPASSSAERVAIIAFRGTESSEIKDVVTDLRLIPSKFEEEAAAGTMNDSFGTTATGNRKMTVHKGFRLAHDSVWDNVLALLRTITGPGQRAPWKVLVTGHSLGGALATLASFKLANSGAVSEVLMYTYGAPRVGNKAFADEFNRLVPNAWRFANENDAVPRVPRLMGYCHVGTPVQLKAGDRPRVFNPEKAIEGKWMFEVGKDVGKSAVEGQLAAAVESLRNPRRDFWGDLLCGKGIAEHMENFYVTHLRQALQDQASEAEASSDQAGGAARSA